MDGWTTENNSNHHHVSRSTDRPSRARTHLLLDGARRAGDELEVEVRGVVVLGARVPGGILGVDGVCEGRGARSGVCVLGGGG